MEKSVFYKGASLITCTAQQEVQRAGLLVEGKTIAKIVMDEDYIPDAHIHVVDCTGKTILPGLINTHVHITMEPVGDPFTLMQQESRVKTVLRAAANLRKQLKSGVTYFRDLGGPDGLDIELKECVAEGFIPGPDFLVSGKVITMTGGHGHPMGRECDGEDEVRKATREQLKAGADVIKVMATGGVMTPGVQPGSPQLTREEMTVAVEEANKAGRKTATHAQGTIGIRNAILAGIDSVEHGIFLDNEVIAMMIERGVYLVPTLVAPYFIVKNAVAAGIPAYAVEKSKNVMDAHRQSFSKAYQAGVKIAMGTDAGTPFNQHDGVAYELGLMVEYGMSPMEAIISATRTAAELLGIEEQYGTLEEGKVADFIMLTEDPLKDIGALHNINAVFKNGSKVT